MTTDMSCDVALKKMCDKLYLALFFLKKITIFILSFENVFVLLGIVIVVVVVVVVIIIIIRDN